MKFQIAIYWKIKRYNVLIKKDKMHKYFLFSFFKKIYINIYNILLVLFNLNQN